MGSARFDANQLQTKRKPTARKLHTNRKPIRNFLPAKGLRRWAP
jgi:hypothetical protein